MPGEIYILIFLGVGDDSTHDIGALFDTQNTGIQTNIIVLRLAPCAACVMLVIDTAALILFCKTGFGALLRLTIALNNAFSAVGNIRKYINMKRILAILKDLVCITANNHAGTLLSQLEDHAALNIPKEVSGR